MWINSGHVVVESCSETHGKTGESLLAEQSMLVHLTYITIFFCSVLVNERYFILALHLYLYVHFFKLKICGLKICGQDSW